MKKAQHQPIQNPSLLDRIACAWLSGATAAITGLVVYIMVLFAMIKIDHIDIKIFFDIYIGFIVLMAFVGFFLLENLAMNVFGGVWRFLGHLIRSLFGLV